MKCYSRASGPVGFICEPWRNWRFRRGGDDSGGDDSGGEDRGGEDDGVDGSTESRGASNASRTSIAARQVLDAVIIN